MTDKLLARAHGFLHWLLHDPEARTALCTWALLAGACVAVANAFAQGF